MNATRTRATENTVLRVIVDREDDGFVARSVDFEIEALGNSPDEAIDSFVKAWIRHVLVARELRRPPFAEVRREERDLADRWERTAEAGPIRPFRIPGFTIAPKSDREPLALPHGGQAFIAA